MDSQPINKKSKKKLSNLSTVHDLWISIKLSIHIGLKGGRKVYSNTINTGKRVKDARKDANLTQTELGKMIGKSKQWVSELERGNIKLSFEMAVCISNACKKTTDFFVKKVHR